MTATMTPRLDKIAELCSVPVSSIEDVYACTPLQASMMAATRDEFFHFVLSSAREMDTDGFCSALRKVVAANSILRTRIVSVTVHSGCQSDSDSGVDGLVGGEQRQLVQVVTNEPHVTELQTGYDDVEAFLDLNGDQDAPRQGHHPFAPHALLFRSAVVGKSFVMTMHHAIADYWSMEQLLKVDLPSVYSGQPPPQRMPFKSFVAQCLSGLEETAARTFWGSRFKGTPAVFPAAPSASASALGSVGTRPTRIISLSDADAASTPISPSHMALYVEAAWALTAALYADSDTVAYGYVLSGRSASGSTAPSGVDNTLGPTITEIPVQAHVRRTTTASATVERLVRDRAAALRALQHQDPAVLQYGLARIAAVSEAACTCAGFQALINIRPSVFTTLDVDNNNEDDDDDEGHAAAEFKFRMVWRRGSFPLQLIFSITEDGVMVWPRTNQAVVSDAQLERILNQYEHCLRVLTRAAPQTKLASLALLDPQARSAIFRQNQSESLLVGAAEQCIEQVFGDQALARFFRPSSSSNNIHFPPGCGIWITTPENPDQLAPWGAVGEVLVQGIWGASGEVRGKEPLECSHLAHAWIPPPQWAPSPANTRTRFFRTGVLAKYETNSSISLMGRMSNRVKLAGGQVVQLEQLERVVAGCSQVRHFVAATRIVRGQTVLVGVICFADKRLPRGQVLKRLPSGDGGVDIDAAVEAVRLWAQSRLPAHGVPALWLPVEELPRIPSSEGVDRVALRGWLSMTLRSQ